MTVNHSQQSSRPGAEAASVELSLPADHEAQVAKLQLDMSKRRAREKALAREQEFLRSSLRTSERLKALEGRSRSPSGQRPVTAATPTHSRSPSGHRPRTAASPSLAVYPQPARGMVNDAFEHDGDDEESSLSMATPSSPTDRARGIGDEADGASTLPRRPVSLVDAVSDIVSDLRDEVVDEDSRAEVEWLQQYIRSPEVQRACDIEAVVANAIARDAQPVSHEATTALEEVQLIADSASPQHTYAWRHQIEELSHLLKGELLESLLEAHDGVAERYADTSVAVSGGSEPRPPPPGFESGTAMRLSRRSDDTMKAGSDPDLDPEYDQLAPIRHSMIDAETKAMMKLRDDDGDFPLGCRAEYNRSEEGHLLKTVVLQKGEEPLGATVRNEGEAVVIGRVVRGGIAYRSQLLEEGDEILSVNALEMRGKDVNEVCDILARLKGTVTFIVVPSEEGRPYSNGAALPSLENQQMEVHVRAQFTYQAEDDAYIPCKELGLSFERGDVLHVISRADPNWWQAYRDGEDMSHSLAGLIPSPAFQLQREQLRVVMSGGDADRRRANADGDASCFCCCKRQGQGGVRRKTGKKFYNPSEAEVSESSMEDLLTYEVVNLYYPQPRVKRPIVLVGPPSVGRHDLRSQLLNFDKERFEMPVTHTTRLAQKGEIDGEHFHFTSKHTFEEMRNTNQFVEWGYFEKYYYGTSLSSVRDVIRNGKVCLLSLQPEALKPLRHSNVKPFVVFIAPPSGLNMMRSLRKKMSGGIVPSDDELLQTIERGRQMEDQYGHLFDRVLVNNDLERSFQQLISEINRLEVEPQWVPIQWLTDFQNGNSVVE